MALPKFQIDARERAAKMLAAFERSGLTRVAFARREGLSPTRIGKLLERARNEQTHRQQIDSARLAWLRRATLQGRVGPLPTSVGIAEIRSLELDL